MFKFFLCHLLLNEKNYSITSVANTREIKDQLVNNYSFCTSKIIWIKIRFGKTTKCWCILILNVSLYNTECLLMYYHNKRWLYIIYIPPSTFKSQSMGTVRGGRLIYGEPLFWKSWNWFERNVRFTNKLQIFSCNSYINDVEYNYSIIEQWMVDK